jgi:hypothetical protein
MLCYDIMVFNLPIYFVQPLLHVIEGLEISYIVHDDDAMGSPIVAAGDGAKTFLSCCVPLIDSFVRQ